MWASRPFYPTTHDNDMMPMDLRKIRRDDHHQRTPAAVFAPRENLLDLSRKRWLPPPPPERGGALESTIRRLHQSSQLKKEPTKEERCRSTDTILGSKESSSPSPSSLEGSKRSNSCPDLTVILPTTPPRPLKPSPIKPKSSFIQRSISSSTTTNDPPHTTGAKKRKSFVPTYGDPSPPVKRRPPSPVEHHSPYDDYYSHPEVLLRRQLQEPPPYLLHVYDYYQQLVQRLRENSNVRCMPPPVSPTSIEDEILVQGGDVNRKRPCRALTGKHVRQGTGASISTLLTLRQKIQERQKAKEHQPRSVFLCNKNGKKGKQQMKAKENALKAYC